MIFEMSLINKFIIFNRKEKGIIQEIQIFQDGIERPIECYGICGVPEVKDVYLIKHNYGICLFDTRKLRLHNISTNTPTEGWSFSELIQISLDRDSNQYFLVTMDGQKPMVRLNKYHFTNIANAFKLMRLEESERIK